MPGERRFGAEAWIRVASCTHRQHQATRIAEAWHFGPEPPAPGGRRTTPGAPHHSHRLLPVAENTVENATPTALNTPRDAQREAVAPTSAPAREQAQHDGSPRGPLASRRASASGAGGSG